MKDLIKLNDYLTALGYDMSELTLEDAIGLKKDIEKLLIKAVCTTGLTGK
tara:strand:+ start:7691 stop:7840 length:150 start_codon:yes stop_codon:yes gene_type:complete